MSKAVVHHAKSYHRIKLCTLKKDRHGALTYRTVALYFSFFSYNSIDELQDVSLFSQNSVQHSPRCCHDSGFDCYVSLPLGASRDTWQERESSPKRALVAPARARNGPAPTPSREDLVLLATDGKTPAGNKLATETIVTSR